MKKIIISIVIVLSFLMSSAVQAAPNITSSAAFVINAQTGDCYYELNADEMLAPASMTKLMTVYIIYEKIEDGTLTKDTMITADDEDADLSRDPEATNVLINEGQSYSIDELIGAILVPSACAACEMVGKYLCGSERDFANLMNETAKELNISAYYEDASGLSDANRITARSMAELARKLISEHPDVLNYTSKPVITFDSVQYRSTNRMLPGGINEYWGNDGLKTGTTTLAGYCNTATAVHDGIRLIAVTMHSSSGSTRFSDTKKLLDFGFDRAYYLYDNLLATDMRLIIDGYEVPSFYYGGPNPGLCFIIEDLKDYGFDIDWDENSKTVTAYRNDGKEITPIPLESYKSYISGSKMYSIVNNSNIKAKIVCNGNEYVFNNVYALDGYTAVSADEMASIVKSCIWNENEKTLDIEID